MASKRIWIPKCVRRELYFYFGICKYSVLISLYMKEKRVDDLKYWALPSTLFEQCCLFAAAYARLIDLQASRGSSCLHLLSCCKNFGVTDMCYFGWLYLGSGHLNPDPHACVSGAFTHWTLFPPQERFGWVPYHCLLSVPHVLALSLLVGWQ